MLVPVAVVTAVEMSVVDVVHMVTVGHGHVPAPLTVLVRVVLVHGVPLRGALVPVVAVLVVEVPVMDVVHVVLMGHGHVPAPLTVLVRVALVCQMCGRHALPRVHFLFPDPENSNNVSTHRFPFKERRRRKEEFTSAYIAEFD